MDLNLTERVSKQRFFSFPLRGWSLLNVVLLVLLKMSHFHCSFETISDCQCNGHSSCGLDGRTCIQPCEDHSEGAHCDKCSRGYYGNPVNGGECNACQVWPLTQFYFFSLFYGNCPPGELISLIGEIVRL